MVYNSRLMGKRVVIALVIWGLSISASPSAKILAFASVKIQNKTGLGVRITFTGPRFYVFTLSTGKNSVSMEQGIYQYSYEACGKTNTGKLKIKGNAANLVLPKCPKDKGSKDKCDKSYPTVCIPPKPPDLDCADIPYRFFKVIGKDPHNFDGDNDGWGCEWY